MRVLYCQKLLFPNHSAHAIHTGLTAAAFAQAGKHVVLFPGAPFTDNDRVISDFFAQLGFDELPELLSLNIIPTRHKGLYGLFFRCMLWRQLRSAPSVCWASSVKEAAMALSLRPDVPNPPPVIFEIHHLISRLKEGKEAEQLYGLEKKVFEQADMVVFNCEALRAAATGYLPKPERSLVSPIGYNEKVITAVRSPEQPEPSTLNHSVCLAYVGSLQPGKGVENLIRALPLLPPHYILTIIGGGKNAELEAMRAVADAAGVAHRVSFAGRVEQRAVAPLLADCDIFVIPTSTDKDFFAPIKMYEALGFGLPVVAAPTASLKKGLKEGENAVFASAPGPDGLAAAIEKVGKDTCLRQAMRRANLAAAKRLTSSSRAKSLFTILEQEFNGRVRA